MTRGEGRHARPGRRQGVVTRGVDGNSERNLRGETDPTEDDGGVRNDPQVSSDPTSEVSA